MSIINHIILWVLLKRNIKRDREAVKDTDRQKETRQIFKEMVLDIGHLSLTRKKEIGQKEGERNSQLFW